MREPTTENRRQNVVLASASPRRRELLARAGVAFTVMPADVDERVEGAPGDVVRILAERKARAVARLVSDVVLAADTLVSLDGVALGKPADEVDARRMLFALSGRSHEVFTGVCAMNPKTGRAASETVRTRVTFRDLTDEEIDAYVASGEPMDKAGAYGIQGGAAPFVAALDGPYDNVMGLPVDVCLKLIDEMER